MLVFRLALVAAISLAIAPVHAATSPADPHDESANVARPAAVPTDDLRVETRGGRVGFLWNDGLLAMLGMVRTPSLGESPKPGEHWATLQLAPTSKLLIDADSVAVRAIAGGEARVSGGFAFSLGGRTVLWEDVSLRVRAGPAPRIDFIGGDGKAWFYLDQLMYGSTDDQGAFAVWTSDMRVAPALARLLGDPGASGLAVAEVWIESPYAKPLAAGRPKGSPKWPGTPAPVGVYEADVFTTYFDAQLSRCRLSTADDATSFGCDGPGPDNGVVVFTPNSMLRNNINNGTPLASVPGDPLGTSSSLYTADVEWETKFNNTVAGPYPSPDQHPYLIWNLFRVDGDGRIRQIGVSGVKHAFFTINVSDPGFPECDGANGGHVLGIACSDTYSTGNNDSSASLGPRSELIPATGVWGRCGSIYDPGCTGTNTNQVPNTLYGSRMRVREQDLATAGNPNFLFESWYLVRDDVNIWNTVATRPVAITWNPNATPIPRWSVANQLHPGTTNPIVLGPAIDRWVAQDRAGLSYVTRSNTTLDVAEGHAKVAVKVVNLGAGQYRYDYVVQNMDFARAVTSGTEGAPGSQGLRVLRNDGFSAFRVPRDPDAAVVSTSFSDLDSDAGNDWAVTVGADYVEWRAASVANSLDWGTLYAYSVVSDRAPSGDLQSATLEVAEAGTPASYTVAVRAIGRADPLFRDGFE
jgi:hypothetical protein